jgi:selenide,water dikinase
VTGIVHPKKIIRNSGAKPDDVLVLTKPIGTGIISTAVKQGLAKKETEERVAEVMATLNHAAAEAMVEVGVNACTDITGFGILGHLREMAAGSGVDIQLNASGVPILEEAEDFAASDIVPGGTLNNLAFVEPHVDFASSIPRVIKILLADAQTSGGLLMSVPPDRVHSLIEKLRSKGVDTAAQIGAVTGPGEGRISVIP